MLGHETENYYPFGFPCSETLRLGRVTLTRSQGVQLAEGLSWGFLVFITRWYNSCNKPSSSVHLSVCLSIFHLLLILSFLRTLTSTAFIVEDSDPKRSRRWLVDKQVASCRAKALWQDLPGKCLVSKHSAKVPSWRHMEKDQNDGTTVQGRVWLWTQSAELGRRGVEQLTALCSERLQTLTCCLEKLSFIILPKELTLWPAQWVWFTYYVLNSELARHTEMKLASSSISRSFGSIMWSIPESFITNSTS